jgi:hypothetical protein
LFFPRIGARNWGRHRNSRRRLRLSIIGHNRNNGHGADDKAKKQRCNCSRYGYHHFFPMKSFSLVKGALVTAGFSFKIKSTNDSFYHILFDMKLKTSTISYLKFLPEHKKKRHTTLCQPRGQ